MWETIKGIPDAILEGIKSLFLPSEGYFEEKTSALREKYAFFESIIDTVQVFKNFFENNDFDEPPVITVDLGNSTGKVNYGTNAKILDLSWYAPYRGYVNGILSAIIWVIFAFNTFRQLPGIISGFVGTTVKINDMRGDD